MTKSKSWLSFGCPFTAAILIGAAIFCNSAGSTSSANALSGTVQPEALVGTGFEPQEGYKRGDLNGQQGWSVEIGSAEVWTNKVYSGVQAARIAPGGEILHSFAPASPIVTLSAYLQATPSVAPEIPLLAQAAVLYMDSFNGLSGLNGDGNGGGNWVPSGIMVPAGSWLQVSVRLDFENKRWDCWVNGKLALSGLHFHSDNVTAFSSLSVGAASGDTLVDEIGVKAENAPPPSEVSLLPFGSGFEPQEGYSAGDLNNQNGWRVESGAAQVWTNKVYSGVQAARIAPGGQIAHDFAEAFPIVTFDTYLQAAPSAAPEIPDLAKIAVLYIDQNASLRGLDGDGNGGGKWVDSGTTIFGGTWFRATIRLDFTSKTWSCSINGSPALTNLHFHANNVVAFSSLTASASATRDTLMDQITVVSENGAISLPTLTIMRSGTAVEISWPSGVSGYRLQAAASLENPRWVDVAAVDNHVREQINQAKKFFRLVSP